jgi:tetratricopeptide (TPR) repeat protein
MLYDKTKLLLLLSLILASLLSNIFSTSFFEFQGKGNTNHNTALALKPPGRSQNNTEIQSTMSPIYQTNDSSSDVSTLINKANALYYLGNYTEAIRYYDKALTLDPKDKVILRNKADALLNQARYDNTIPGQTYKQGDVAPAVQNFDKATQAMQYYDKALAIDPNYKEALSGKGSALDGIGNAFYNQGKYTRSIQYYNKALAINSTGGALYGKQDAISKIAESAPTSAYNRGCIDAQIPNPSERYINQSKNGPGFHSDAFMQAYNEGFDTCSGNLPKRVETLKMFNVIVLKDNVTDETANTRICTTVSGEYYPQTICQNLDNLKPKNGSNSIESNLFTFENVPVNASFHSCIQRLIYPNVTLCDNYGSTNNQGPTIEQTRLPFFGVDPTEAEDDEGYTICPQYLTEVQCYGKMVKTPDDGYDVNDTSIDQVSKRIALAEQQLPVGSLTANQTQVSNKPIVTNQTVILKEGSNITLQGIDPNNKSLNFSIYTQPAKGTITFTKINSTSVNATYFPLEDGILTDSFSYKASNGVSDSNIGKVILTFFPAQTSDNGNTSSNVQSQPPVNQSLREQQQPGNTEPNQTYSFKEPSAVYYEGLDWWGICNNSLVHSYISQPCETLVTPDHRALTLQGKTVLEKILCQKGPSVLSTIELFYGSIPDKAKNELSNACGWH